MLHKHGIPSYLRDNPTNERNFLELFDSLQTILTTSHVIGEIQGHQKLTEQTRKAFWLSSMSLLERINIDERLLSLRDMYASEKLRELVCIIGSTDTGLIELARQERCTLLTDDERTLNRYARILRIDCRLVKNLL
ncbi:MAG: PIN domain-containing protein [Pyrinomonadaceae bacterium]